MYLRGGTWRYDIVINGTRYLGNTRTGNYREAEKILEEFKASKKIRISALVAYEEAKRNLIALNSIPLEAEDIWKAWQDKTSHPCKQRATTYMQHLYDFVDFMHVRFPEVKKTDMVFSSHAVRWFAEVRRKSISESTMNSYLTTLKAAFNAMGKEYGILENPFQDIKKLHTNPIEREAFTVAELELIGKHATGWIYDLCVTAISTGLREGDICTMLKSSVDLANGWLTIKTNKTGMVVEIPILPGLRSVLQRAIDDPDNETEYVFPVLEHMYVHNKKSIGKHFKDFLESIGVTGTKVAGVAKDVSVKDIHSFRHTFCYLAAVNGIPFPIVQSIVGHASPKMTRHYMDHASRVEKTKFLSAMPSLFGSVG